VAGYSSTPLIKKLGIKEGSRVAFVNAPPGFAKRSAQCRQTPKLSAKPGRASIWFSYS